MSDKQPLADCAPGTKLAHYYILEKIGTGGMGEVFRARDEHLDREVAIKVLPLGALADETARARLRREALTLSRLNHPGIATIHDFDTYCGRDLIVMELIPGTSLREKLQDGPLPEKEVVRLGLQLAEGLAEAHTHAIIHRDLKPGNLRITPDGRLKILDFGLARLVPSLQDTAATATTGDLPSLAGTLAYMSPEQLLGEKVDARTDIHAVGIVLYEMTTGQSPFLMSSGPELIASILRHAPPRPTQLKPMLSSQLERIIQKCLEKNPRSRYQTAKELVIDLQRLQAGIVKTAHPTSRLTNRLRRRPVRSLAVLPFVNLSGDLTQEYFADGMTESLITDLGRLTGLKTVIGRGSVMRYKNTQKGPAEIARELNVDALMTGAVLRSGNRVRVTTQLIQPKNAKQLWTENYEYDLRDILQLQSEVTRAIAAELRVELTAEEQASSVRLVNPEAYDAYLLGRHHFFKMSPQGLDRAAEYFQLALDKDPNYAPAHVGIGYVWAIRAHTGLLPAPEAFAKARVCALKALEVDSALPEAHGLMAGVLIWHEWKWELGEKEYCRAIELNASEADVRCFYSFFLHAMGRSREAHSQMERALELDPYNSFFHMSLGHLLHDEHRPDEALIHLQRAATLQPDSLFVHYYLWLVFEKKREYDKAVAEAGQYYTLLGAQDVVRELRSSYAQEGYRGAMRRAADMLAEKSQRSYASPMEIALLYASAEENDRTLDWLEKAYEEHSSRLGYVCVTALLRPLHSLPRFQELVRRMNFPAPPQHKSSIPLLGYLRNAS